MWGATWRSGTTGWEEEVFNLSCEEWVGFPRAEIGGARVRGIEGYSRQPTA